jgi:glyoxylase-like metal-dependent hydrolase (beta-lactamase superfamily II)
MQIHEDGDLRLIKVGPVGPFANNAYVIADAASSRAVVVDMPTGSQELLDAANDYDVSAIILTHTHPDHWAEFDLVKGALDVPVICNPAERILPADKIDRPLADGDEIAVGSITIRAIHTPGHTPGSTCLLAGRFLISGDTLFPGGPGRTNSADDLQQSITSITERLYELPDDTLVFPGHGDDTTIEASKREYAAFASREHPADLFGDVLWEQ